jgi:Zn-finger nucleic acid-binding protein
VCFALSPLDAEKCVRCGALLPAEALNAVPGTCPDCKSGFVARQAGVAGFSECPRCGGLFLARASFDAVVKDAATRARARALDDGPERAAPERGFHYRACPVCRKFMNRSNFGGGSGVIVDVCGRHGAFLDRGELTRIVDFVEKGGWEKIRKREILRMEEEAAALESRKRAASDGGFGVTEGEEGQALSKVLRAVGEFLSWW